MNGQEIQTSDTIIEIRKVRKTYPYADQAAIRGVDLEVVSGERWGLIGANGSGKTTLFRLILNFVVPDSGTIKVCGEENLERARRWMGFIPEKQEGLENFTPRELLELAADMFSIPREKAASRIPELLQMAELTAVSDTLITDFSKGMIQRVQLCLALIHDPKILLLDEPMSGLDPGGQKEIHTLLHKIPERTIVYASHNLEEVETFCTKVAILHEGKIVAKVDLSGIPEEVYTFDINPAIIDHLTGFPEIQYEILEQLPDKVRLQLTTTPVQFQQVISLINRKGWQIQRLRSRSKLEEVYHKYVKELPLREEEQ